MKVFGIAGWSGSGKTTLIEKLIPLFVRDGIRVATIKHAHHQFDIDQPGKDSFRHRAAGAGEVMVISSQRWVLMHELRNEPEPDLQACLERISPCDLVLVEGFKKEPIPKLEVYRSANGKSPLYPEDGNVIAVASDDKIDTELPRFGLDQVEDIVRFIGDFR
jgi:molybdopterin-guanine dinucleotide biosynthesis protein B